MNREASFAADPEAVYAFVGRFFRSLEESGVRQVCISPGSRSTPLCVTSEQTSGLRTYVGLDERATSFFALGLAKVTGRPVALVCTSGTAAANYLPAIVEAHYSRIPLLVLTADRPPELRDWGAGQTIEQVGLFGGYCRWAVDVPMAEGGDGAIRYAMQLAARAVDAASGASPGPVHLNWSLREPLPPPADFFERRLASLDSAARGGGKEGRVTPKFSAASSAPREEDVEALVSLAEQTPRGVICAGPRVDGTGEGESGEWARALATFSRVSGWPVIADPASDLRGDEAFANAPLLCAGDSLLRAPRFSATQRPEVVLRLGEPPVSKAQRLWIEQATPREVWWLDEGGNWGEPSHLATRVIRGSAAALLTAAAQRLEQRDSLSSDTAHACRDDSSWCRTFVRAEQAAQSFLSDWIAEESNFGGLSVAAALSAQYSAAGSEAGIIFSSNSMAIRLLDLASGAASGLRILSSRGASGIDGINSTALGVAAGQAGPTALLTGDLAFLHDLSGLLMAKQEKINLTIVVMDDDGGGIFSFLPIADQGERVSFEKLFGTPHGIDLARVAALFDFHYDRAASLGQLRTALSSAQSRTGLSLVHVPLDREENAARFRAALKGMSEAVDGSLPR